MKKLALVFMIAVFLPSLVLAWLAVRSLHDEQLALERQQTLLSQGIADRMAQAAVDFLADRQREFGEHVEAVLARGRPDELAGKFDDLIRADWPLASIGFAVSLRGNVLSPPLFGRTEARNFRLQNDQFLCNREIAEVYWNNSRGSVAQNEVGGQMKSGSRNYGGNSIPQAPVPANDSGQQMLPPPSAQGQAVEQPALNIEPQMKLQKRVVQQQFVPGDDSQQYSKVTSSEAEFRQLIGEGNEGSLARFVQNKLAVMFWHRSSRDSNLVFGAQLNLARLKGDLAQVFSRVESSLAGEAAVALLDDNAQPVSVSPPSFHANWRRPFVAAEIGEVLPHWEVAVYLLDPAKLARSAANLKYSVSLLVALLVLAIVVGGGLIVRDLQRELALARQKTDFVSNVSHELKTPLTSIRMFSELLAEDRVTDAAKRRSYLAIITAETARLTRLINNVLDFSRIERGEKKYHFELCDIGTLARETAESYRPHLESMGFTFECDLPAEPVKARVDRDAVAQVLVNLISNAEKYSGERKEILFRLRARATPVALAEISVLDRGPGVPEGSEERIFEQFYRAHDSLSSGIQGSGLGLTLARQIARAHGGEVAYERREGGGSVFTVRLPVAVG